MKWAKDMKRNLTEEDIDMANMLCITCHQGNTNQNHNEIPPHTSENDENNKTGNNKCWRGCGEGESSCTVGGNVNWCSHSGKLCGGSSKG